MTSFFSSSLTLKRSEPTALKCCSFHLSGMGCSCSFKYSPKSLLKFTSIKYLSLHFSTFLGKRIFFRFFVKIWKLKTLFFFSYYRIFYILFLKTNKIVLFLILDIYFLFPTGYFQTHQKESVQNFHHDLFSL